MRLSSCVFAAAFAVIATVGPAQKHNHNHDHKKAKPAAKAAKKDDHKHNHGHAHEAPNGGTLIVFGDEFAHLEVVLDKKDGSVAGYVLDGEAVKGIPIKQETIELEFSGRDLKTSAAVTLKAVANPLTGETVGSSSEFRGKSDALKNAGKFNIRVKKIEVKGQVIEDLVVKFPEGNH